MLEADSALQFQGTAGKSVGADAELWIGLWCSGAAAEADDCGRAAEGERSDVEFIECVVSVKPQLDLRIFAQERHLGNPKLFYQAEIEFAETRSGKSVPSNAWERDLVGSQVRCQGEIAGRSVGKIG